MLSLLQEFETLDVILILAVSLWAGLMLRYWHALAWFVFASLAADFALPLLYTLATGAGWDEAWSLASMRYVYTDGGTVIWRTVAYFAVISLVFLIKVLWRRR